MAEKLHQASDRLKTSLIAIYLILALAAYFLSLFSSRIERIKALLGL